MSKKTLFYLLRLYKLILFYLELGFNSNSLLKFYLCNIPPYRICVKGVKILSDVLEYHHCGSREIPVKMQLTLSDCRKYNCIRDGLDSKGLVWDFSLNSSVLLNTHEDGYNRVRNSHSLYILLTQYLPTEDTIVLINDFFSFLNYNHKISFSIIRYNLVTFSQCTYMLF